MMKRLLLYSLILLLALNLTAASPKREMRGAWVATIYGLDWPKTTGTDRAAADAQRAEMDRLLDRMQRSGCNAVMFQARTFSDAMYPSDKEPWASALTGKRGVAPVSGWDPLAYVVEGAHKRGMECHAWINPFRYSVTDKAYTDRHAVQMKPLTLSYIERPRRRGEKAKTYTVLDPGNPAARRHVVDVCRDILTRYDVDGLIFDDYFYPDRLPLGHGYDYNEWRGSGSELSQADWRRENVNTTLREVYNMVKEVKPWAAFGVSPAGVGGGNGVSASRYGMEPCTGHDWMYDRIYCDPLAWMSGGYVDYISPQLYWARDHKTNPYRALASWWADAARRLGCDFYASHSLSSMAQAGGNNADAWQERGAQIEINREVTQGTPGSVLYAARNMNEFGDYLARNQWSARALPPVVRSGHAMPDPGPVSGLKRSGNNLRWDDKGAMMRYAVYAVPEGTDLLEAMSVSDGGIDGRYLQGFTYSPGWEIPQAMHSGYTFIVSPLDRAGNEWEPATL